MTDTTTAMPARIGSSTMAKLEFCVLPGSGVAVNICVGVALGISVFVAVGVIVAVGLGVTGVKVGVIVAGGVTLSKSLSPG